MIPDLLSLLSPSVWSAGLGFGLTAAVVGALALQMRRARPASLGLAVLGATLASLSALALDRAADLRDVAVVVAPTALRVSPAMKAPELASLAEGTEVVVQDAHGGFARVDSPAGSGWLPDDALARVIPDTP